MQDILKFLYHRIFQQLKWLGFTNKLFTEGRIANQYPQTPCEQRKKNRTNIQYP